eukprot:XP_011453297.1 PREDICTED: neurogenic locus notch homolog protein 1-like [Crassostrea gigas]
MVVNELAGSCSNSTCEINETCKHKRYSEDKFFECVLSDCGIPDKKGINLSSIKREDAIGLHRRIHASCSDGYSQSGSGRLICQSNGEWKYDIVCEDINEYLDDPCDNGGTCSNNDGSFKCTCAGGFTGTLCNEVPLGIALGKHAEQSSTYRSFGAEYAVDGNRGTYLHQDKCAHTGGGDTNPWWRVDLLTVYSITSVRILNRGIDHDNKDYSNRLRDVTVTVGLTESDVNTPCGFFAGPGTASQLVVINCLTSPQGIFVKISTTSEYLTLCEVDVFGVSV